jgi:hypothetical protein
MARDEMHEITVDKWDNEVWGAEQPSPTNMPRTKLFFYFGENDHWVADHTRDTLMRLRGRCDSADEWRPWMEIDKMAIPHGFSISGLSLCRMCSANDGRSFNRDRGQGAGVCRQDSRAG